MSKRFYPQLVNVKRGESPWCRGEEGRRHVGKPEPEADGRMLCKHCGVCVGWWGEDNGQLDPDNQTVTMTRRELRALIEKYAGAHGPEHHADCRTMHNAFGEGPCTCGYADIFGTEKKDTRCEGHCMEVGATLVHDSDCPARRG